MLLPILESRGRVTEYSAPQWGQKKVPLSGRRRWTLPEGRAAAPPNNVMNSRRFTASASVLPTERIPQHCCTAGFQFGLCRLWVNCGRACRSHMSTKVRFALKATVGLTLVSHMDDTRKRLE